MRLEEGHIEKKMSSISFVWPQPATYRIFETYFVLTLMLRYLWVIYSLLLPIMTKWTVIEQALVEIP